MEGYRYRQRERKRATKETESIQREKVRVGKRESWIWILDPFVLFLLSWVEGGYRVWFRVDISPILVAAETLLKYIHE